MAGFPFEVEATEYFDANEYQDAPARKAVKLAEILLEPNADPKDGHFLAAVATTNLLPQHIKTPLVFDREPFQGEVRCFLLLLEGGLKRQLPLSLEMIRHLAAGLHLPAEVLILEYALHQDAA